MPIYNVNNLKDNFKNFLETKYTLLKVDSVPNPRFGIVLVGDGFSSMKYAQMKLKLAIELGIEADFLHFQDDVKTEVIQNILEDYRVNGGGLLFQLPIRSDLKELVYKTPLNSDVDLLGSERSKLIAISYLPPTIGAIDLILKDILTSQNQDFNHLMENKISLKGINIAVIGQGVLVGSPLIEYLLKTEATIISVNIHSNKPKELTQQADILISATGKADLIDETWLKKSYEKDGIIFPLVIDAGTSEGKIEAEDKTIISTLVGDVNKESVEDICTLVGVPGGVGPITVRYIFWNLYRLYQN